MKKAIIEIHTGSALTLEFSNESVNDLVIEIIADDYDILREKAIHALIDLKVISIKNIMHNSSFEMIKKDLIKTLAQKEETESFCQSSLPISVKWKLDKNNSVKTFRL